MNAPPALHEIESIYLISWGFCEGKNLWWLSRPKTRPRRPCPL